MLPYPDAELYVKLLLEDIDGVGRTVTALPPDFDPPIVLVNRIGGAPDVDDVTDFPLVLVSCYGTDRPSAWALAGRCQARLLTAPGTDVPGGVLLDSAEIATGNQQLPDLDPDDRRVDAVYRLGFRRQYHLP